jgi:hypothetical protein
LSRPQDAGKRSPTCRAFSTRAFRSLSVWGSTCTLANRCCNSSRSPRARNSSRPASSHLRCAAAALSSAAFCFAEAFSSWASASLPSTRMTLAASSRFLMSARRSRRSAFVACATLQPLWRCWSGSHMFTGVRKCRSTRGGWARRGLAWGEGNAAHPSVFPLGRLAPKDLRSLGPVRGAKIPPRFRLQPNGEAALVQRGKGV